MDAITGAASDILGLLGTIGAYGANDGYYDPEAHEAVANTTARIRQAGRDGATKLYGVPESDFDRRIAEGTTELIFVGLGAAGLVENLAARAGGKVLTTGQKGSLGEAAAARTLRRAGYEELPARLSRNNGFDGVWVKRGPDGRITDVIITESKYSSSGSASLTKTKTMGKQLSDQWIDGNIEKMLASDNPTVRATGEFLLEHRSAIRTKANVLDPEGTNRWNVAK